LGGVAGRLQARREDAEPKKKKKGRGRFQAPDDPYFELKQKVQEKLPTEIKAEVLEAFEDETKKREYVVTTITRLTKEMAQLIQQTLSRMVTEKIVKEITDDVLGLGPLEDLLNDDDISEVMVNGPWQIYVEKKGKLTLSDKKFRDNSHVAYVLDKIVSPLGRRIDESSPMVDARLADGSRVNAIIPPLALAGPTITIRKFSKDPLQVSDLIGFGSLTEDMADFIAASVKIRMNVFVSGGTGSGKTTTLNILSSFIPGDERIVTIEDAAELQLRQEHVVSLETRPANIEGDGEVSMRELVKNCLRMRPERIIVGEVRSGEALDMLQAMNTGHDGSLTTGHANSPRDMISRLETMVMMAGMDLPAKAIREQISSAVHLIVQQNRLRDGARKITHVTEVQGMDGEKVLLADIFRFEQSGVGEDGKVIGRHRPTGIRPSFMNKFLEEGIVLPDRIFEDEDE
jgi:pilus assembly protein CpaF